MKSISGKDFAKLLEQKGWELRRTKGSHHIYAKEGSSVRISVPDMESTVKNRFAEASYEDSRN